MLTRSSVGLTTWLLERTARSPTGTVVIMNPYRKLAMVFPKTIVKWETGMASCVSKVPFVRSSARVVTPIEER
jgi:hypothetical protein